MQCMVIKKSLKGQSGHQKSAVCVCLILTGLQLSGEQPQSCGKNLKEAQQTAQKRLACPSRVQIRSGVEQIPGARLKLEASLCTKIHTLPRVHAGWASQYPCMSCHHILNVNTRLICTEHGYHEYCVPKNSCQGMSLVLSVWAFILLTQHAPG